jgi:predicted negative regulator of RcsB-dependent stress response
VAAEKKISRKELLKEPDEFLTSTARAIRYARENPKVVSYSITAAIVVILVALGINVYLNQRQTRSHELFESAFREYEALAQSPDKITTEKLDKLFTEFDSVAKDYPSLASGEMALLYSGHVLYKKQDYKGALERYNNMQSTSLVKKGLGPLFFYHIAMTRLALNDYEQALVLLEQLSNDTNSPYRREAHASIARIYEMMGKKKEAVQAYRQYLKMFPEAPDEAFIKAKIADLSAHG